MGDKKMIGLILLVVGAILLFFAWQSSGSLGDQVTETLTGRFTDKTMWFIFGGAICVVAGVYMALLRK